MHFDHQPQKSWWGRNWMWIVPVGCLTPLALVGGCTALLVVGVFGLIKSSDVYTESLASVQANEQVQRALGHSLQPSWLVSGNVNLSNQEGNADIQYDVTGSKGTGTVHAVADRAAGQWTFRTLSVVIKPTGEQINLLADPPK